MKSLLIAIFLTFLFNFRIQAQESTIQIFYNTNDCINCTIGLKFLDKINTNVKIDLIIKEDQKKVALKYLNENFNLAHINKIITSDDLFIKNDIKNISYFIYKYKNQIVYKEPLNKLTELINSINTIGTSFENKKIQKISLNNLTISNKTNSTVNEKYYAIHDNLFNNILIYNIETRNLKNLRVNNVDKLKILNNAKKDTIEYKLFKPLLDFLGKGSARIEQFTIKNDTLISIISIPYAYKEKKDTIIDNVYSFFEYSLINNSYSFKNINYELPESIDYYYNNTGVIIKQNDTKLLLSISPNEQNMGLTYFMGEWIIVDNEYKFNSIKNSYSFDIKDSLDKYKFESASFFIHNNLLYFSTLNTFFDINNAEKIELNKKNNFKYDYIIDIISLNNLYIILYNINNSFYLSYYDKIYNKIVATKKISYKGNIASFRLLDNNSIIGLDKTNEKILIIN
jgi:hypothetical protein